MLLLPQLVITLATTALLPVQRHVGRWTAPPRRVPTAMMFDSPIVANGDAGLTFGGPPEHTTFYASSNSFWSANQVVDAPPQYAQHPGGAESYTQVRIHSHLRGCAPCPLQQLCRRGELHAARRLNR
jgi:hypothetical protein